jgi:hypothetical protein
LVEILNNTDQESSILPVPLCLIKLFMRGFFWVSKKPFMPQCFTSRPSNSSVPEDAGIKPATLAFAYQILHPPLRLGGKEMWGLGHAL